MQKSRETDANQKSLDAIRRKERRLRRFFSQKSWEKLAAKWNEKKSWVFCVAMDAVDMSMSFTWAEELEICENCWETFEMRLLNH